LRVEIRKADNPARKQAGGFAENRVNPMKSDAIFKKYLTRARRLFFAAQRLMKL
jgi:hypothetical protein